MKRMIAMLAVVLTAPSDVYAQVPDSVVKNAESQSFGGRKANIIYSVEQGGSWDLVSVFSQPFGRSLILDPHAEKRWTARRQSGRGDTFSGHVRWADSSSCSGLEGILWSLERLIIPSVVIDGVSPNRPNEGTLAVSVVADGPVYSVWGYGLQPDGAQAQVYIRSIGGELYKWGNMSERVMSSCWGELEPTS